MDWRIELKANPTSADRAEVARPLDAFNDTRVGDTPAGAMPDLPLALLIVDDGGMPQGGLWGRSYYGWLFVELLFVPEAARGHGVGTELMRRAEAEAARRGCHGVWLDSFSFQAPGFYRRLGYAEFGVVEDYPPGHTRHFLKKRLAAP
jgi:GNAT superfamily N-acetyltransferase